MPVGPIRFPLRCGMPVRCEILAPAKWFPGSCCDKQGDGCCESQFGTVSPRRRWSSLFLATRRMCPTGAVPRPTRSSIGCFLPTGITTGRSDPRGAADRQVYDDFFKGEREFQRDASNRARTYYEAALARDSTFIPAAWRLSIVYRFLRVPLDDYLRRLYESRGPELPEPYRELTAALLDADLPRRFERYRATVAKFPGMDMCASFTPTSSFITVRSWAIRLTRPWCSLTPPRRSIRTWTRCGPTITWCMAT